MGEQKTAFWAWTFLGVRGVLVYGTFTCTKCRMGQYSERYPGPCIHACTDTDQVHTTAASPHPACDLHALPGLYMCLCASRKRQYQLLVPREPLMGVSCTRYPGSWRSWSPGPWLAPVRGLPRATLLPCCLPMENPRKASSTLKKLETGV